MKKKKNLTICSNCQKVVVHPNYIALTEVNHTYGGFIRICRNCYTPSASEGILTRTSDRVKEQQSEYGADLVPPHTYDKESKKLAISEDFVKLYPENLTYFESEESITKAGYPKLADKIRQNKSKEKKEKEKRKDVVFEGDQNRAMGKFIKQ